MELKINTSPKNVEMANFLLKQAYDAAIKNPTWLHEFGVTRDNMDSAEQFRKSMLKAFTKPKTNAK